MSWKEGDAERGGIETCPVERSDPGLPRDAGIRHTIKSVSSEHAGGKGFVLKVTLVMLSPRPPGQGEGSPGTNLRYPWRMLPGVPVWWCKVSGCSSWTAVSSTRGIDGAGLAMGWHRGQETLRSSSGNTWGRRNCICWRLRSPALTQTGPPLLPLVSRGALTTGLTWPFPWLTLTRCWALRQDRECPLLPTGPETLKPRCRPLLVSSSHKHVPFISLPSPEGMSQHQEGLGEQAMNSLSEQQGAQQEGQEGAEEAASSGWEFADGQEGGLAGDVIPEPVLEEDHTVLPRAMVVRLILLPVAVGQPLSCHIHKPAFSHLIRDAQEGYVLGHILDGFVLLGIFRGGHSALELDAQSLHFGKRHLFTVGHIELLPSLFAQGEALH